MILRFINDRGAEAILTDEADGSSPFVLQGFSGGHGIASDITAVKQFQTGGSIFVSAQPQDRAISLSGFIYENQILNRLLLLNVFSTGAEGYLICERYEFRRKIFCVVEQAPSFDAANGVFFKILLFAPDPFWTDENATESQAISATEKLFKFQFSTTSKATSGGGFTFGIRNPNVTINVFNGGEADCGFIATMRAAGSLTNPELIQTQTGEYIRFLVSMNTGDRIEVSTIPGKKYATLYPAGASPVNAMNMMDTGFTFFQLKQGDNTMRASSSDGSSLLDCSVIFEPKYQGV